MPIRNSQSSEQAPKQRLVKSFKRKLEHKQKTSDKDVLSFANEYLKNILRDAHNRLPLLYGAADFTRDCESLNRRLANEGVKFLTASLPILMNGLLNILETGQGHFPGFKLRPGKNYPRFLRRLFAVVLDEHCTEESQAQALDFIYSFSVAFKKLRGEPDKKLHQRQYDEFVEVDKEIGQIDLANPLLADILSNVRSQWSMFAHDITLDSNNCRPRPGPGSVVGSIAKSLRYAPHVRFKQLDDVFPYEEWFYSHPWDVVEQSRDFLALPREEYPYSQYLLVPKTYDKWRGICKESNEAQFLQQALRRLLSHHIKRKLSSFLPLDDQSVHATYALESSKHGMSATIDESEASDRILRSLVSYVAQDNRELHDALMAVSTRYIKPPKWATQSDLLETNKYAPMGSAVCFPVMSLIHLFLIRAIIMLKSDMTDAEKQELCQQVSVYGDDIVLPSSCTELVFEWLPRFGMKINQSKSFYRSKFRESCGCHAFNGVDITPIYIKYTIPNSASVSSKAMASLIANEHDLFIKKGWYSTAKFLRKALRAKWRFRIPYVRIESQVLGFKRPSTFFHTYHLSFERYYRKKWDSGLQCHRYRLPTLRVKTTKGSIPLESQAYLRWLLVGNKVNASYTWRRDSIKTPFTMNDGVHYTDDEAQDLQISWVSVIESAL